MFTRITHLKILILIVLVVFFIAPVVSAITTADTQAQLQQQLNDIEKEIASYEKQLSLTVSQKNTLANKIKQLKIKQQELSALIKKTTLQVKSLETNIVTTQAELNKNITKEEKLRNDMAGIIRMIHEKDLRPMILLASLNGLSSAFIEVQNYLNISASLVNLVQQVKEVKQQITEKKSQLEDQKSTAVNLLQVKSIQSHELAGSLTEQNTLLQQTKGLEVNYASTLADKKKQAAQIRSRIYELFNTGTQLNFGQALDIANWTAKLTGIRPAFILAVLTQESNLGKNVGTCNRAGDPVEKSWKTVMKPERDQEPFVKITKELGLNPDTTPVSCPMHNKDGSQLGWGGAMGPAQFIPSTWIGYKDKVSAITGKSPANPWDIRDAFVAAAVKLRAGGANGTEKGEWNAAMIYFSGSTNSRYSFYGDNVIALAKKYQQDIDDLN